MIITRGPNGEIISAAAPPPPDPAAILTGLGIDFTTGGEPPNVTALYLMARKHGSAVLLVLPRGARANLRALARQLGLAHLRCGHKLELIWSLGQTPETLSPFGLANDAERACRAALDERLLACPLLGFPLGRGRPPLWLTPGALLRVFDGLGYRVSVGDFSAA